MAFTGAHPASASIPLKWITAELHMGTWTHVANRLQQARSIRNATKLRRLRGP